MRMSRYKVAAKKQGWAGWWVGEKAMKMETFSRGM